MTLKNIKLAIVIATLGILVSLCLFYFQWGYLERRLFFYLMKFVFGYIVIFATLSFALSIIKKRILIIFFAIMIPFISTGLSLNIVILIFHPLPYKLYYFGFYFIAGFILTQTWIVSIINGILTFFLTKSKPA
jgi:hypothetical protein